MHIEARDREIIFFPPFKINNPPCSDYTEEEGRVLLH